MIIQLFKAKMECKGHKVELSMLKYWVKEEIIGCKTECTDG